MVKFTCDCGKKVRDVYFKNGVYMCAKCFWQGVDNPYDYLINMLASKGLVIKFRNEDVLVLKQFSADFLEQKEQITTPDENWLVLSGDDFWAYYTGLPEQLRCFISEYGLKKDGSCEDKEDN